MYESPITRITEDIMKDIEKREEDYLIELVHKVGFDIDKEELAKALRYDRDQYEKGFDDGGLSAGPKWIPVTERNPKGLGEYLVTWKTWAVKGARHITVAWYTPDSLGSPTGEWMLPELLRTGYPDPTVVAWMPLPECYRGDGNGE